ncbi:DUF58 domain-containing protein [Blastopirellula marina]|uniref:DUF58 domain-containing protein n=1 Tax=Blastopirellula marina DSM 3645 TaxID=314230 RepID=A3ZYA3_9BACT|nr:DUF58 domain-containing protein [Blastopirellula marina]EAQ78579.1 hypothetical protein DSM3645_26889 [Blastopirellula marina DSM 3645]
MIPREVFRKIRRIQIRTSHKVDELLAGNWHSAFKGRGIEFEEVRPYQVGDDVRTIDWNVTARSDQPYVKLFREERELAVSLLVDLSASQDLGTTTQTKRELVAELGAILAMSAIKNNDKVGLTLFTDDVEKNIPARKGSRHVLRLIRELLCCEPVGVGTNLRRVLEHLNRTAKRRTVVFLISDFQDSDYESALKAARRRHDIIPVIIADPREAEMPNVGLVRLHDAETGQVVTLDTGSRKNRQLYAKLYAEQVVTRDSLFRRLRLDPIHLQTGCDLVDPLRKYFHQRENRQ